MLPLDCVAERGLVDVDVRRRLGLAAARRFEAEAEADGLLALDLDLDVARLPRDLGGGRDLAAIGSEGVVALIDHVAAGAVECSVNRRRVLVDNLRGVMTAGESLVSASTAYAGRSHQ